MATVYRNPSLAGGSPVGPSPDGQGYTTYKEPDTSVPPKPLPVMKAITVDGVAIPEEAILHEAQNHPADNPGEALRAAAHALVVRQLLLNEARRLDMLCDVQSENGQTETFEDAAIRALTEREVNVPAARDDECRRFYELNRDRFTSAPLYEARHILVAAPESDAQRREKARLEAQDICNALQKDPRGFSEVAKAVSACSSAAQGGNLGQLSPGSTVPEFEAAMAQMMPGEITRSPVATRFGFHVIALDRAVEARQLPFEAVKVRIADWLEAQTFARAVAQYVSILAGRAKITGIDMDGASSPLVQ